MKQVTFSGATAATAATPKVFINVPTGTQISVWPESAGSCDVYYSTSNPNLCITDIDNKDFVTGTRIGKALWFALSTIGTTTTGKSGLMLGDATAVVCVPVSGDWRFESLMVSAIDFIHAPDLTETARNLGKTYGVE